MITQTTQYEERIWERLPAGEPPRAYYYARTYFELGPTRSIERVNAIVKISPRQLKRWSARCHWVDRAVAYDHWRQQEDMKEAEAAYLRETEKWAQRAAEHRERVDQVGVKLEKLGESMLSFPPTEARRVLETDATGRPTSIQIVKSPRCAKRHIPRLVDAADRLAKQAFKEAVEENSIEVVNVFDIVPYESQTAPVAGGSETNRERMRLQKTSVHYDPAIGRDTP